MPSINRASRIVQYSRPLRRAGPSPVILELQRQLNDHRNRSRGRRDLGNRCQREDFARHGLLAPYRGFGLDPEPNSTAGVTGSTSKDDDNKVSSLYCARDGYR
jgi:hypothetical protein